MVFQSLQKKGNKMTFVIKDLDLALVNGIRRVILSEIPNVALAFDTSTDNNHDVSVHTNTSSLHNEYIMHRISLIPFHFDEDSIHSFDASKYIFRLQKKNNGTSIISVTTADIKVFDEKGKEYKKTFCDRIFPRDPITNDHILITRLHPNPYNPEKGEELDIEFKLCKDIGKRHCRWCPVSQCCFVNVKDDKAVEVALKEKLRSAEEAKGSKLTPDEKTSITTRFHAVDAHREFKKNKYGDPCEFLFKLETECAMRPEYLVFNALAIIHDKVMKLASDDSTIRIKEYPNLNMFDVHVENENHTLLNVLQSFLYNKNIRDANTDLTYAGYTQLHPLYQTGTLKLKFKDELKMDSASAATYLKEQCMLLAAEIKDTCKEWCTFCKLDKAQLVSVDEFFNEDVHIDESPNAAESSSDESEKESSDDESEDSASDSESP